MPFSRISVNQANQLIADQSVTIMDIRDPQSFNDGHIANAIHVTNDNVKEVVAQTNKDQPLIIYCYHGNSSQGAADYFSNLGFKECYSVDGGYEMWKFSI